MVFSPFLSTNCFFRKKFFMREIEETYPKWLEDNKATLSSEEYKRYRDQYELTRDLNQVYETEPSNFNKIVELMQKMQECGQPPNSIVQEIAPDFDISTPVSSEFHSNQLVWVLVCFNLMHRKHVHFSATLSLPSPIESYVIKFKIFFGLYPVSASKAKTAG